MLYVDLSCISFTGSGDHLVARHLWDLVGLGAYMDNMGPSALCTVGQGPVPVDT